MWLYLRLFLLGQDAHQHLVLFDTRLGARVGE